MISWQELSLPELRTTRSGIPRSAEILPHEKGVFMATMLESSNGAESATATLLGGQLRQAGFYWCPEIQAHMTHGTGEQDAEDVVIRRSAQNQVWSPRALDRSRYPRSRAPTHRNFVLIKSVVYVNEGDFGF